MICRLTDSRPPSGAQITALLCALTLLVALMGCTKRSSAQTVTTNLDVKLTVPFRFVAYGDTRFHDPKDTAAANPAARMAIVQAIADAHPAFICFTGDIVYKGSDGNDWKIFDHETRIWRAKNIPVFPALGNHELHGDEKTALGDYFRRFPDLNGSRYYSVRAANTLFLVLDSSADEVSGPQGKWLKGKLDDIPSDVDFIFLMLHHPPYTSSSTKMLGEGHSARPHEQALAKLLEERQGHIHARFIVFSGHVHNYERHEHGGVVYFVSGGGGAHAYPIERAPDDPYQSREVNYHYLLLEVDHRQLTVTMNRLQFVKGKEVWTQPDSLKITFAGAAAAKAGAP
jgi:hypothetical protein